MTYNASVSMSGSTSLRNRCTAAAAGEGIDSPEGWVATNWWKLLASPGWTDQWTSAVDSMTVNQNPDLGMRDDVITDGNILAAVQAVNTP
jgi:hypothetical protein